VVIGAEAVRQPEVRELYVRRIEGALDQLRTLIAACLRAEGRVTRNARHIAAAVLSAIEGAYLVSAAAPGTLPAGYASPTLRRMIEGLLAAEPSSTTE
jgi:TetR/AcrR family transcriptional repressor of bet genes